MNHQYMPGSVESLLTALLVRCGYPHTEVRGPDTRKVTEPDYDVTIYATDGSVMRTMRGAPQELREQIAALPKR